MLRRQCAVAASLWAIHARTGVDAEKALPRTCDSTPQTGDAVAKAVVVQLDTGSVFVIRGLQCGMLFVAIGGPPGQQPASAIGAAASPSPGELLHGQSNGAAAASSSPPLGSPSEQESVMSSGTPAATSVTSQAVTGPSPAELMATKRQAEELARWLDDKLGQLAIPEETAGGGWDVR
jgi:hypothetical protein